MPVAVVAMAVAFNFANAYLNGMTYPLAGGGQIAPVVDTLHITSFSRPNPDNYAVEFNFTPGKTYKVYYSTNLSTWIEVPGAVFTFPSAGISRWIDDGSQTGGVAPKKFYKVSMQ